MSKNKNTLTILFSAGHSLILGHKPDKLSLKNVGDKLVIEKQDTEKFGLFDSSTPNYTTYYPEVSAEDLNPKESEFIYPVFRLLSEVILNTYQGPIDFTKPGVLKKSKSLLVGQTINVDHETAVGNAIGAVVETEWQESYVSSTGVKVPAGINGTFKIDGKANPRLARGIMMDPPSIHSNSVTVTFEWEKSHPKMADEEFRNKMGTYDGKGVLVRRVVSNITFYQETSLVSHGADPWAQKIKGDGEINNPKYANTIQKRFSAIPIFYDWKNTEQLRQINPTEQKNDNMENLIALAEKFGFTPAEGEEITIENLTAHIEGKITSVETLTQEVANLQTEKENLTQEVTTLTNKVTELEGEVTTLKEGKSELSDDDKDNMERGKTVLSEKRNKVVQLYKTLYADKADVNIIATIENSNFETAESFNTTYQAEFDAKYPHTCQKCHSTDVSRRTSVAESGTSSDKKGFNSFKEQVKKNQLNETVSKMHKPEIEK
jgi:hypothetical protein